jgi:predicted secreted Zn-dependent protease
MSLKMAGAALNWFAGVLIVLASQQPARADNCPVTPVYNYYAVEGRTESELEASLREKGPRDELGQVRFAYTDWTVKWNWKRGKGNLVDLDSVKITCLATILLPKVAANNSMATDLVSAWEGFVERTRRHELNHVSHIEQLAPLIVSRIRKEAQSSSGVTIERAQAIAKEVIAKIRAKDREYDAATVHGKTEGTWRIIAFSKSP